MNEKKKKTEEKNKDGLLKILKGSIISIVMSLAILFLMAVLLTYTNIPESIIPIIIIVTSVISILTGSIFSTIKINRNGLLNGGIIGIIYIITIYIISSITIVGFHLNLKSMIMLVISVLAGMVGGIIGVNLNKNN